MKSKRVLKFESAHEVYPDIIVPAKSTIPKWYKDQKPDGVITTSFKRCVPLLDSLTTGYLVKLPIDLYVTKNDSGPNIDWRQSQDGVEMVGFRLNDSIDNIPSPAGYYKDSFFWKFPVSFQVPVGYSALVTQPLNRFDLPFFVFSVVIDGGYTLVPGANMAFYLKEDFKGIIEQGTPIAQIFLIKNESWKAEKTKGIIKQGLLDKMKSTSLYSGWYKQTWWTKKDYS